MRSVYRHGWLAVGSIAKWHHDMRQPLELCISPGHFLLPGASSSQMDERLHPLSSCRCQGRYQRTLRFSPGRQSSPRLAARSQGSLFFVVRANIWNSTIDFQDLNNHTSNHLYAHFASISGPRMEFDPHVMTVKLRLMILKNPFNPINKVEGDLDLAS